MASDPTASGEIGTVVLTPDEAIGALAHASWQAAQAGAHNSSALQSGEALFAALRGAGIVLAKRSLRAGDADGR